MQLLGIGITRNNLNSIAKNLQKNLSHQLNSELFDDPRLASDLEIQNKEIQNVLIDIIKLKPDWIIIYSEYFRNPEVFVKLIKELKNRSKKTLHVVMVFENFKKNLNSFFKFIPEFELVNKMNLKIYDPELILEHNIKSFPRVRLNSEFVKIHFINCFGELVSHSIDEIPVNTIIPFKDIKKFETNVGKIKPNKWLGKILKNKKVDIHPKDVTGILFEKKGCYLFPGIPFNSIMNIKLNEVMVEHVVLQNECKKNNPPFKRLIKSMEQEYQEWLKVEKDFSNKKTPIYCLMQKSIIKEILENLFNEMGYSNVKIISEINSAKKILKNPVRWLKLNDYPSSDIYKSDLDWSLDLINIISPLNSFVDLNELKTIKSTTYFPIHKTEFEKFIIKISNEEKEIQKNINQTKLDELLHTQEMNVFKKLDSLIRLLMEVLESSRTWEESFKNAMKIKQSKILLVCEEESLAAELNLKFKDVQRKLWINPFRFKKPEDLIELNSKMIKSYLKPKYIVINSQAKMYLKNLCRQANLEFEKVKKDYKEKNLKIKHSKTDLNLVQKNKKNLALRWLNVSIKQLLYRDRHLFKSISENVT